jgi:hypothetical protein
LGSLDDIDGCKMLWRVVGRLPERDQELGDDQLGDIVLLEPQDHRHFSGSQTGRKAAAIKEQGLFIKGNGFLGVEHRRAF